MVYYCLEALKFLIIYRLGFGIKFRRRFLIPTIFCVLACICISMLHLERYVNPLIIFTAVVVFFTLSAFRYEWHKLLFLSLWSIYVIATFDMISDTLVSTLFTNFYLYHKDLAMCVSSVLTLGLLCLLMCLMNVKRPHGLSRVSLGYYVLFLLIGLLNDLILAFVQDFSYSRISVKSGVLLAICIGFLVQMFTVLMAAVSNTVYKEKERLNASYLNMQVDHYNYLKERELQTKKFRHDIRNHLYLLNQMAQDQDIDSVRKYLRRLGDTVELLEKRVHSGNGIVDAILNRYMDMCNQEGITLQINGHIPDQCNIEAFDLCVIFSNFMQNAYEAAMQCTERFISVTVRNDDDGLFVEERNTYSRPVMSEHGRLLSQKEDNSFHGFGFDNMRECIEKYSGQYDFQLEKEHFVLRFSLLYR